LGKAFRKKGFFAPKRFLRLVVLFIPRNWEGLVVRPMKSFPLLWMAFLIYGSFEIKILSLKLKSIILNRLPILLLIFLLVSCQYFGKEVPSKDVLLQKELQQINWKEVDEFPSVAECEKIEDKELRQQCFFEFLTSEIQQKLSIDTLAILYPELDTIQVKVTVFPNSEIKFEPQFPKDSVTYDRVKIDSILQARLATFPKINPALKRGIPVKTQFILPVILKVE